MKKHFYILFLSLFLSLSLFGEKLHYDNRELLQLDLEIVWPLLQTVKIEYDLANAQLEFLKTQAERDQCMEEFEGFIKKKYFKKVIQLQYEQGQLLLLLIHRELGKTPYELLGLYRNRKSANFWQKLARIMGTNLKDEYSSKEYPLIEAEIIRIHKKDTLYSTQLNF